MTSQDAPTAKDGMDSALGRCIERLEQLIDAETAALRGGDSVDFGGFNSRKAHALLEFIMLTRSHPQMVTPALAARVAGLEHKLADNARLLQQHLRAISEICDIAIKQLQAEESDGTYSSRSIPRRQTSTKA